MLKYNYIEVTQPIGTFYLCSIPAVTLLNVLDVVPRSSSNAGVQRDPSLKRIKEIGEYCTDPDAVFPTPIVISINEDAHVYIDEQSQTIDIPDDEIIGEIIDGQHRLWGIKTAPNKEKFHLPVVMMFDLSVEEKAYIFSTINSNQQKVDPSLIYDLFDVSKERSPQKTVHEIARVMNYNEGSPFYNRLKMLGKKELNQNNATLSQGTFAKSIVELITKDAKKDRLYIKQGKELMPDKKLPFRQYFIDGKDEIITKIIFNCFNALRIVFPYEWDNPKDNILWKTTGFCGIIKAMPRLYEMGATNHDLTQSFFEGCFYKFKDYLSVNGIRLTSDSFPGGSAQNQALFRDHLLASLILLDQSY